MTSLIDRTAASRALAQAIAFANCGNRQEQAEEAARRLVTLLNCAGILNNPEGR